MRSTEQEPSLFSRASSPQKSQKPAQHTSPSAFKTPSRQYSIRLSSGWVAEGVTRTLGLGLGLVLGLGLGLGLGSGLG